MRARAMNIYVEDTGIGIPAEALRRIARPFEQRGPAMRNGMKGSGLGLAIARSLVELHGGTMRIRSSVGSGTIVGIQLPLGIADSAARPHRGGRLNRVSSPRRISWKILRTRSRRLRNLRGERGRNPAGPTLGQPLLHAIGGGCRIRIRTQASAAAFA